MEPGKLEKRGDIFLYYLNDHLLGIGTGSVLPENAKLGFHIYGTTLLDNFKLTELGAASSPTADLGVTQTVSKPSVAPGSPMTYTVTVSNGGPAAAANVKVSDTLPAGASFVSAAGLNWSCSAASNVVTCTLVSLSVGNASPIAITCIAPLGTAGTYVANVAVVSSDVADATSANNSSTASVKLDLPPGAIPALGIGELALLALLLAGIACFALLRQV